MRNGVSKLFRLASGAENVGGLVSEVSAQGLLGKKAGGGERFGERETDIQKETRPLFVLRGFERTAVEENGEKDFGRRRSCSEAKKKSGLIRRIVAYGESQRGLPVHVKSLERGWGIRSEKSGNGIWFGGVDGGVMKSGPSVGGGCEGVGPGVEEKGEALGTGGRGCFCDG